MQVSDDRFQAESGWNMNVRFINTKQAKEIYQYRKTRETLYKTKRSNMVQQSMQRKTHFQFHPDSAWKRSSETCMKLTSAECTVENS